uniref:SID1 transmembrane family member 1 n=1 Tax=Haemonchus contortus TaxID=6289 RepID=A0A7I5ECN4_HAECO|nr:C. briggsae CBR-SID-1 protein [Haemonchus contortus]
MLLSIVLSTLLLAVTDAKRGKGNSSYNAIAEAPPPPGVEISVGKAFTSFILSTGRFVVVYAVLGKEDALDLHRIHCIITNAKEVANEGLHFVQVTASNGRGSVSFSLPEATSNGTLLYEGARVVHPLDVTDFEGGHRQILTATVQSRSFVNVSIGIRFSRYDRAQYDVRLSHTTPSTRYLRNQRGGYVRPLSYRLITTGIEVLRVLIESNDDLCAQLIVTGSEEDPYARNIEHFVGNGCILHQMEFTRRLDLVLQRKDVPETLLMFIFVNKDDQMCGLAASVRTPNNLKLFNITWVADNGVSILKPISVLIALYLLPIASAMIYARMVSLSKDRQRSISEQQRDVELECLGSLSPDGTRATNAIASGVGETLNESLHVDSAIEEYESDVCDDVALRSSTGNHTRTIGISCKSEEWSWSNAQVLLVLLPIISLVIAMPAYSPSWSNSNCYHNYACSEPFWIFMSFNHMFSNVGYMLCSIVFLAFVHMRKGKLTPGNGTYNNHGLEVCMGLSLLCEAFASTVYHICPNSTTYNLDTPFIEILCVLIILKLYGNRRKTISAPIANMAAVFMIFADSVITIFAQRSLTHFLVIICSFVLILFGVHEVFKSSSSGEFSKTRDSSVSKRWSIILSLGVVTLNILVVATIILPPDRIQPNQILTIICLTNTSLYFLYYIFMKWQLGEQSCRFSRVCSASAAVLWMTALYFLFADETDWALTPAQSRALNRPCVVLSFYDYHDLWHITSALASLMTLVALSTIDDAVSALPTSLLTVF